VWTHPAARITTPASDCQRNWTASQVSPSRNVRGTNDVPQTVTFTCSVRHCQRGDAGGISH
jgi:hypothetical protein